MRTTLMAIALATVGSAASAATVLIDDFNGFQRVVDLPLGGSVSSSQVADAGVLGGFRDLQAMNDNGSPEATELRVGSGTLGFSNVSGESGSGTLTYDGDDDPTVVTTTGLGGFDLTYGGLGTGLVYDVVFSDFALLLTVNAWDMTGGFSSFEQSLPALGSGIFGGSFSDFVGDADLTDLGALQFVAGGDGVENLDARVRSIGVNIVPLPASAVLLGGALFGMGVLANRRRRSA